MKLLRLNSLLLWTLHMLMTLGRDDLQLGIPSCMLVVLLFTNPKHNPLQLVAQLKLSLLQHMMWLRLSSTSDPFLRICSSYKTSPQRSSLMMSQHSRLSMIIKLLQLQLGILTFAILLFKTGKSMEILKWFTFLVLQIHLMIYPSLKVGYYTNGTAGELWDTLNHRICSVVQTYQVLNSVGTIPTATRFERSSLQVILLFCLCKNMSC